MINPQSFVRSMRRAGIEFCAGVPDSLLKEVCSAISFDYGFNHVIAANEGAAVGLAMGHFFSKDIPALIYMQNSGLGNAINPLVSLSDPKIYGVPMLLLIGWRGEISTDGVQIKDEPQHIKQGEITLMQLQVLGIPYEVINGDSNFEELIEQSLKLAKERFGPVAIVVRKDTFSKFDKSIAPETGLSLSREDALKCVLEYVPKNSPIISTTGMLSRELYEFRSRSEKGGYRDLLMVGGMGHASSVASGIALSNSSLKVICLDGDGAVLMHMGALSTSSKCQNLIHIIFNNGAHDSVGGQPTESFRISLSEIARACAYQHVFSVSTTEDLIGVLIIAMSNSIIGSAFIEIKCKTGARPELGRPKNSPAENVNEFKKFLKGEYENNH